MTDGDLLLAAILAHPEEDTPRLMYADWLQEHGDEDRAEFIRVQCALARFDADTLRRSKLVTDPDAANALTKSPKHRPVVDAARLRIRSHELWSQRAYPPAPPGFVATLHGDYFGRLDGHRVLVYQRGFGARLECPAADWLAHADAILAGHPVRRVRLTTWPELHCPYYDHDDVFWELAERAGGEHFTTRPLSGPPQDVEPSDVPDVVRELLAAEWPGIAFELPPA